MAEDATYPGICSSCTNAPACTYLQGAKAPVLQCEEFAPYDTPERKPSPKIRPSVQVMEPEDDDRGTLRGLCASCEHRSNCAYERPEGGVWHCEEYE